MTGWSLTLGGCICAASLVSTMGDRLPSAGGPMPRLTVVRARRIAQLAGIGLVVAVVVGIPALSIGAAAALACAIAVATKFARRLESRRRRTARQLAVIELCDALGAELRAGLGAYAALEHACDAWPEWRSLAQTEAFGGDVADALRRMSKAPGAQGLAAVAGCWEVAARSGVALADVLDRVAAGLRADDDARVEVAATLGAPRATAKLLAALPAFGLLLGSSTGARPLTFLLQTPIGLSCLGLGVLLALAGVVWVERLANAAEV